MDELGLMAMTSLIMTRRRHTWVRSNLPIVPLLKSDLTLGTGSKQNAPSANSVTDSAVPASSASPRLPSSSSSPRSSCFWR
jgi:hypothetical protein